MIIALQGKRDIMGKLVFGKNGQVHFNNENEKQEAIEYLLTSDNVDFDVHEDNQEQGAWGPEERIHFKSEDGVPDCLKRLIQFVTLNCQDRFDVQNASKSGTGSSDTSALFQKFERINSDIDAGIVSLGF